LAFFETAYDKIWLFLFFGAWQPWTAEQIFFIFFILIILLSSARPFFKVDTIGICFVKFLMRFVE
jgi:hypothetical protein